MTTARRWQWRRVDDAGTPVPELIRLLNLRLPALGPFVSRGEVVRTVTADVTLAADDQTDCTVLADATTAPFTVTLPAAAAAAGRRYVVKKIDASANAVTVAADGADLLDGASTVALPAQWDAITFQSDGTHWYLWAELSSSGGSSITALTGDVTATGPGSAAATLAAAAITGKTTVTADGADYVLISDTSDSGALKKALASDLGGGGGMSHPQVMARAFFLS